MFDPSSIPTKIGIVTIAREPLLNPRLFESVSWRKQPHESDEGWPKEVQVMLDTLYANSGIGDSEDARLKFWVSFNTDSLNPSPISHTLGLWETQFLASVFPDQFPTC